jgi:hypothetical protein
MEKSEQKGLRLMVKPPARRVPRFTLGKWDYKWVTEDEIAECRKEGYVLLKEVS